MQQGVSLYIDPSGAQTGGRVVKREFQEIGAAAVTAQQRIEQMTTAQMEAAKSAQASAQVMMQAQDALRAKYNPTFAVIQRYKAAQDEIRQAHRLGALSSAEMTAAMSRERQAALANIQAIKGYGAALTSHTAAVTASNAASRQALAQRANLVYQLNDIGVSLASGMNPLMVLIQQGSQISTIYGGQGGVGKALRETASMAAMAAARFWPLAAAGAAVYGAYRLISSYSIEARHKVSDLTRAMAEQAMSAGQLKSAVSEFQGIRSNLIDAQGISGALSSVIGLQGNYSEAIKVTGITQRGVTTSIVADLKAEYGAKRSLLEIEQQLQQAKIATLKADLAISQEKLRSDFTTQFNSRPDLEAQGFVDPKVGRLTQIPGRLGGAEAAQDFMRTNENAIKVKRLSAELTIAELAAKGLDTALGQSFAGSVVQQGLSNLNNLASQTGTSLTTAAQGANTLSTSLGSVSTAAQASLGGVAMASQNTRVSIVNVTEALAKARISQVAALQQTTQQITTMKKELADVQAVLANAAKINPSELFGNNAPKQAAEGIAKAVGEVNTALTSLRNGTKGALEVQQAIERARQSLLGMGADSKAVDQLINGMIAAYMRVMDLTGGIKQLSATIMGIPNRVISIGIQQYTVPTAGGGSANVNVHGGNAEYSYQQYSVGGGKKVGVLGMAGDYSTYDMNGGRATGGGGSGSTQQSGGYNPQIPTSYTLGGKQINVYGGARASGGPVDAGKTYLVGENGPELFQMPGAGHVTNTNSTAAILSGGRDTLSLIEDHLYDVVQELRIHTNYLETFESDFAEMIACLKAIKTVGSSSSYSGGGSSYSSGSSYSGSSSSDSGNNVRDPMSPYYFNAARNNAGRGGGRYDPVADALINGNTEALRNLSGGPTAAISRALAGHNMPSLLDRLKKQAGFATGGQIMPGEDQKVEFFKRNKERVIIVDDNRVSDQRGGQQQAKGDRAVNLTVNFNSPVPSDQRSQQAMADQFRRAVIQVR